MRRARACVTTHLELRPPTEADLDAVLAWRNHPLVNGWLLRTEVHDGMGQGPASPARGSEGLLGYLLDPGHHGRGYATEIARVALDLAFGDLGLRRVTAGCFADNIASWRVMEKVGMRREQHGIRDSWHAELGWVDGYTYALLADEHH